MRDFYKNTRQLFDDYNAACDKIMNGDAETDGPEDELMQNFCIHLAHALIKDTGYDSRFREELCKTADIINDVCR